MVDKDKEFKGTRGCKQESRIKKSNLARQSRFQSSDVEDLWPQGWEIEKTEIKTGWGNEREKVGKKKKTATKRVKKEKKKGVFQASWLLFVP